jgi:phosphohistidine phosphatase
MPKLFVFRHGEAAISSPDFDRPLTNKGLSDIERVSEEFSKYPIPNAVLVSSPSTRTVKTSEILHSKLGPHNVSFIFLEDGYLAEDKVWLTYLEGLSEEFETCIIVGHNPGIMNLVKRLTGEDIPMPPGTGVVIDLLINEWREIFDNTGEVVKICTP